MKVTEKNIREILRVFGRTFELNSDDIDRSFRCPLQTVTLTEKMFVNLYLSKIFDTQLRNLILLELGEGGPELIQSDGH